MFVTFLSRLMSSLLTTLLFVAIVGLTANQTILNTHYVEAKLKSQDAYSRLSTALSQEISKKANSQSETPLSQPELEAQLKKILTAEVLQAKIETTLKQLQDYYQHNGPVPTLDISDLVQQANENGLQIDAEKYDKPIKLTGLTKTKQVSDSTKLASIGALVFMAILFAGVLAIAIKRRDFRPLANIVFVLGLMLSISGTALLFVPGIFTKLYRFNPSTNPFGSLTSDLATSTIHDFGLRLLIYGLLALLLGIAAKFFLRKRRQKRPLEYAKADKESAKPDVPVSDPVSIYDVPTTPAPTDSVPGAPAPRRPSKPRKIQG
jgi:hypothetical protein